MFQNLARWCPCGCESSYLFQWDDAVPPKRGDMLHYTCPGSREVLSFRNEGPWVDTHQDVTHKSVKVSLQM